MYIVNEDLVEFVNVISSSGLVGVAFQTNLPAKKEITLICRINTQISGAGSKDILSFKLLNEYQLTRNVHLSKEAGKTTIKWTVHDQTVYDRVTHLLEKLEENGDIVIMEFTSCGSIVMWFTCKTKEALQKLRSIIESGDIEIFLTIIFSLLSDSSEELKVNIKAYTIDLKWAEDYFHEEG